MGENRARPDARDPRCRPPGARRTPAGAPLATGARSRTPGSWACPGGYLAPGETLEASIRRHLAVKVDVRELSHLEQLETLSDPERDPGEWQLATAYLGLVPSDVDPAASGDTAGIAVDLRSLSWRSTTAHRVSSAASDSGQSCRTRTSGSRSRRPSSRSRSSATCTSPRSATRSRRRTSSGFSCAGACSS